jgi:NADH-quinone oxidoreductase subunit N
VATRLGLQATVFYLAVYLVMNLAAFAVIVARERETPYGDDLASLNGLGASRPLLAWPMTIAMLALAGFPATGGFIGKFYLIDATVDNGYTWLAIFIVIGSMISLGYYLRVIAAIWMTPGEQAAPVPIATPDRPVLAGGSEAATGLRAQGEIVAVAVVFGALTLILGIVPSPLLDAVRDAGAALGLL